MKRIQSGFTLIELMIVVAIIGILAVVAIPQYQDYIVKAKLSKAAAYADPIKTAIAVFYQENGDITALTLDNWSSLGMGTPSTTTEVSAVSVAASTGAITITLNAIKAATIDGTTVVMSPTFGNTAITWRNACSSTEPVVTNFFKC